ncbi:MAG: hypothetical protein ACLPTZ_17280, partial [Beijerinckiaceae bacterium]
MLFTKARPAPSVKSFFSGKPLLPIGIAMSVLAGLALLGSLAGLKEAPTPGEEFVVAVLFLMSVFVLLSGVTILRQKSYWLAVVGSVVFSASGFSFLALWRESLGAAMIGTAIPL